MLAGGYAHDTVGEDMELVVRMHRRLREAGRPYRVRFVPDPVCWTEAPETVRVLRRQRNRWHRGLIDTLWRHRVMFGRPRFGIVGLVAMPTFVLFEMLGPLIELSGYVIVPLCYFLGILNLQFMLVFLAVSVLYGILLSVSAVLLEDMAFRRYPRARDLSPAGADRDPGEPGVPPGDGLVARARLLGLLAGRPRLGAHGAPRDRGDDRGRRARAVSRRWSVRTRVLAATAGIALPVALLLAALGASLGRGDAAEQRARAALLVGAGVVALGGLAASLWLGTRVMPPLLRLTRDVERTAAGAAGEPTAAPGRATRSSDWRPPSGAWCRTPPAGRRLSTGDGGKRRRSSRSRPTWRRRWSPAPCSRRSPATPGSSAGATSSTSRPSTPAPASPGSSPCWASAPPRSTASGSSRAGGIAGRVLTTRRPVRATVDEEARLRDGFIDPAAAEDVASVLAVPMILEQEMIGLIYVANRTPIPFTEHDEAVLLRLAVPAALAVRNARLVTELGQERDLIAVRSRELARSEAQLRGIVQAASDGILTVDRRGRITSVNRAAERMFGYPAQDVLARDLEMLVPAPLEAPADAESTAAAPESAGRAGGRPPGRLALPGRDERQRGPDRARPLLRGRRPGHHRAEAGLRDAAAAGVHRGVLGRRDHRLEPRPPDHELESGSRADLRVPRGRDHRPALLGPGAARPRGRGRGLRRPPPAG